MIAIAKSASGKKATGLLRECKNGCGSIVGIKTRSHRIIKTDTAVVDQGTETAIRTGYISTHKRQKGDRVAYRKSEAIVPRCRLDFAASNTFIGLHTS
jgi:hypothetical protein